MIVKSASTDRTVARDMCNPAWIASLRADDPGSVDSRRGKDMGKLARSARSKGEGGPLAVDSYPDEGASKLASIED